jgi:basic amino acid/polyamine antiporter, APA family
MPETSLERQLGLWATISVVAGGVIGSGIFMKPAVMAGQLGSPVLLLGVWMFAGLITLCGALTNAEVAAMMPETGGQYVFFQKMYGDFGSFFYGFSALAVFNTAGVASLAYVFSQYMQNFVEFPHLSTATEQMIHIHIPFIGDISPLQNSGVKGFTILTIILLTYANCRSVKFSAGMQVLFTVLKIAALFLLVGGILLSGRGDAHNLVTASGSLKPRGADLLNAFIAATAGAFWAYDGWNNITFVAGEIKEPRKNIPRGLFVGLLICIVAYMMMNVSYIYALPIDSMAQSKMIAADASRAVMGTIGAIFISLLVVISTFGTTNGNILATARVTFAMAREKRFFSFAGEVHRKFRTPAKALIVHCIWTCLLVLSGSFDMLTDMLIFISWVFYGLSAAGVMILRKKMPDHPRPYKVWGYPFVPLIFIGFSSFFVVMTLVNDVRHYLAGEVPIINSLFGILLTLPGVPLYWYFKKQSGRAKERRVKVV